jgi:hypothetical protein
MRWDRLGIPHKGWTCVGIDDLGEGNSQSCEMCGNERVRFLHVMEHPEIEESFSVGCVCSAKMTGDYAAAQERTTVMKNRAERRRRWLTRTWKLSQSGNPRLNIDGKYLTVYRGRFGGWGFRFGSIRSKKFYPTLDEAKLALFDCWWEATNGG